MPVRPGRVTTLNLAPKKKAAQSPSEAQTEQLEQPTTVETSSPRSLESGKASFGRQISPRFADWGDWGESQFYRAQNWLKKEQLSQESCRSLPFTALFYVSFLVAQLMHRDVPTVYPMLSSMKDSLVSGLYPTTVTETPRGVPSALPDVMSWGDALTWVDSTMVPFLWPDEGDSPGMVMGVNQLIGGARLQQWRLKEVECPGDKQLGDAYGDYLRSKHNRTCRSMMSEYDQEDIVGSRPANDPAGSTQGSKVNDGLAYTYWLDANQDRSQVRSHVQGFRDSRWISSATERLLLQTVLYAGQVGWFVLVEVDIQMDRVGAFVRSANTKALQTQVYAKTSTVVADGWFCVMVAWLFLGELFSLIKAMREGKVKAHVFQVYRMLNLFLIFGGVGVIMFFMWLTLKMGTLGEELTSILSTDVQNYDQLDDAYDAVSYLSENVRNNELVTFWYSMMMLLKFFQNFQANERLAVITKTLGNAAEDLFHFLLIFLLVFFNFIIGAYFLFGQSLLDWSSYGKAFTTGFRALMGDFDFTSMYLIAPVSATMWFTIYMLFIFLLLVNMLLAIVMDAYAHVKEEAGESESIWELAERVVMMKLSKWRGTDVEVRSTRRASKVADPEPTMTDLGRKIVTLEKGLSELLRHHGIKTAETRWSELRRHCGIKGGERGTREGRGNIHASLREAADAAVAAERKASVRAQSRDTPSVEDGEAPRERLVAQWAAQCDKCGLAFNSDDDRFCRACGLQRSCSRAAGDGVTWVVESIEARSLVSPQSGAPTDQGAAGAPPSPQQLDFTVPIDPLPGALPSERQRPSWASAASGASERRRRAQAALGPASGASSAPVASGQFQFRHPQQQLQQQQQQQQQQQLVQPTREGPQQPEWDGRRARHSVTTGGFHAHHAPDRPLAAHAPQGEVPSMPSLEQREKLDTLREVMYKYGLSYNAAQAQKLLAVPRQA